MPDFTFYRDVYLGDTISEADFPRLIARAGEALAFLEREYTATGDETARMKALCALAEAIQATNKASANALAAASGEGAVASESIGSVSVSYQKGTAADAGLDLSERGTQWRYYDIARRYLTIYRGVG